MSEDFKIESLVNDDEPIETTEQDVLKRDLFVNKISGIINSWQSNKTLVLAVNGKWGSGKTSVINLVRNKLITKKNLFQRIFSYIKRKLGIDKEEVVVIEFKPWVFSGYEQMTTFFYQQLREQISKKTFQPTMSLITKLEAFQELINPKEYKNFFSDSKDIIITGITALGFNLSTSNLPTKVNLLKHEIPIEDIKNWVLILLAGYIILQFLFKLFIYICKLFLAREKDVVTIQKNINETLIKNKTKLVIIIDDIDRLKGEEILEVLKLVKANANFSKAIYLLSFDLEAVKYQLEGLLPKIDIDEYLEKIVQFRFDIPKVSEELLVRELTTRIDKVINLIPQINDKFSEEHWADIFHTGFNRGLLLTIRDIKRFINILALNIKGFLRENSFEVNIVDLIVLSAIQSKLPDLYKHIQENKTLFTESNYYDSSSWDNQKKGIKKKTLEKMYQDLKITKYKELLERIFPQLKLERTYDWQIAKWTRELRICTVAHFDTYFTLIPGGVPDSITQYDVDLFVGSLKEDRGLEEIFGSKDQKSLQKLISKVEEQVDLTRIDKLERQRLLKKLFSISDSFDEDHSGSFTFDNLSDITFRVAINHLKQIKNEKERVKELRLLINSTDNWYAGAWLVNYIHKEEFDGVKLFTDENIRKLRTTTYQKIKTKSPEYFLQTKKLNYLIHLLRNWGKEKEADQLLETVAQTDEGVVEFMKLLYTTVRSSNVESYHIKITERITFGSMEGSIGIEKAKEFLERIKKNKRLAKKESYLIKDIEKGLEGKKFEDME